jgi:hypothetical protein
MPDHTRASTISWIACEKLEKLRVRPALLVSVQPISSVPKNCWSVLTIEPLSPGVPGRVLRIRRVRDQRRPVGQRVAIAAPSAIAVIGRQNDQNALSSQTLISASGGGHVEHRVQARVLNERQALLRREPSEDPGLQVAGGFSAQYQRAASV